MCTRGAEGDAPQLTPREADFQRDTQDSKPALLGPDALLARRDPVRARGDDWLLELCLEKKCFESLGIIYRRA